MSIHLSGSVAYDRIMTFPGQFEDHLLPEKLHTWPAFWLRTLHCQSSVFRSNHLHLTA